MDSKAVEAAIAELAPMLQADGADLILLEANPATARIEVRLDVTDASCAECVLPTPLLEQVISDAISRRMPSEFELVLRDPRVAGGISG
jgi:Fe-S cluster biogenesis protein NfuA